MRRAMRSTIHLPVMEGIKVRGMTLCAHAGYWIRAYLIHTQNCGTEEGAHQLMFTIITHDTAHLRLPILDTSPSLSRKDSTCAVCPVSSSSLQRWPRF